MKSVLIVGAVMVGGWMTLNALGNAWREHDLETWLPKGEKLATKYGVSKERYAYYVRHHDHFESEIGVGWDCNEIKRIEQDARESDSSFADVSNTEAQEEAQGEVDDQ
jgi:hypothetical protein